MNERTNKNNKRRNNRTKSTNSSERTNKQQSSKVPQLVKDTSNFQYNWPLGTRISLSNDSTIFNNADSFSASGVMSLLYYPTVGKSTDTSSPINVAVRNLYTYVRHIQSGHINYDAADIMMYHLGLHSAYCLHAFMVRAYGLLTLTSFTNRYYPVALYKSMGLNYEDFKGKAAQFRTYINLYAQQISSLANYQGSNYTARQMQLLTNIYLDSDNVKPQTYIFNPGAFHKYVENDGAGYLQAVESVTNWQSAHDGLGITMEELMQYANAIKEGLLSSEDINIISADMYKAFGSDKLVSLPLVDETYHVEPIYDLSMLIQINNATVLDTTFGDLSLDVTQNINTGSLMSNPFSKVYTKDMVHPAGQTLNKIINMPIPNPSPVDTFMATRFTTILKRTVLSAEANTATYTLEQCGTELIGGVQVYYYCQLVNEDKGTSEWAITFTPVYQTYEFGDGDNFSRLMLRFQRLSQAMHFAWRPQAYANLVYEEANQNRIYPLFDLDNYTVIQSNELYNMHEVYLAQMFEVPLVGMSIK